MLKISPRRKRSFEKKLETEKKNEKVLREQEIQKLRENLEKEMEQKIHDVEEQQKEAAAALEKTKNDGSRSFADAASAASRFIPLPSTPLESARVQTPSPPGSAVPSPRVVRLPDRVVDIVRLSRPALDALMRERSNCPPGPLPEQEPLLIFSGPVLDDSIANAVSRGEHTLHGLRLLPVHMAVPSPDDFLFAPEVMLHYLAGEEGGGAPVWVVGDLTDAPTSEPGVIAVNYSPTNVVDNLADTTDEPLDPGFQSSPLVDDSINVVLRPEELNAPSNDIPEEVAEDGRQSTSSRMTERSRVAEIGTIEAGVDAKEAHSEDSTVGNILEGQEADTSSKTKDSSKTKGKPKGVAKGKSKILKGQDNEGGVKEDNSEERGTGDNGRAKTLPKTAKGKKKKEEDEATKTVTKDVPDAKKTKAKGKTKGKGKGEGEGSVETGEKEMEKVKSDDEVIGDEPKAGKEKVQSKSKTKVAKKKSKVESQSDAGVDKTNPGQSLEIDAVDGGNGSDAKKDNDGGNDARLSPRGERKGEDAKKKGSGKEKAKSKGKKKTDSEILKEPLNAATSGRAVEGDSGDIVKIDEEGDISGAGETATKKGKQKKGKKSGKKDAPHDGDKNSQNQGDGDLDKLSNADHEGEDLIVGAEGMAEGQLGKGENSSRAESEGDPTAGSNDERGDCNEHIGNGIVDDEPGVEGGGTAIESGEGVTNGVASMTGGSEDPPPLTTDRSKMRHTVEFVEEYYANVDKSCIWDATSPVASAVLVRWCGVRIGIVGLLHPCAHVRSSPRRRWHRRRSEIGFECAESAMGSEPEYNPTHCRYLALQLRRMGAEVVFGVSHARCADLGESFPFFDVVLGRSVNVMELDVGIEPASEPYHTRGDCPLNPLHHCGGSRRNSVLCVQGNVGENAGANFNEAGAPVASDPVPTDDPVSVPRVQHSSNQVHHQTQHDRPRTTSYQPRWPQMDGLLCVRVSYYREQRVIETLDGQARDAVLDHVAIKASRSLAGPRSSLEQPPMPPVSFPTTAPARAFSVTEASSRVVSPNHAVLTSSRLLSENDAGINSKDNGMQKAIAAHQYSCPASVDPKPPHSQGELQSTNHTARSYIGDRSETFGETNMEEVGAAGSWTAQPLEESVDDLLKGFEHQKYMLRSSVQRVVQARKQHHLAYP
eukprot:Rmarinus@m.4781